MIEKRYTYFQSISSGCLFRLHMLYLTRNSVLKRFFENKDKKGTKKAIAALARKILCILQYLLVNGEKYQEDENSKIKNVKLTWISSPVQMKEKEMIDILVNAGYVVQKKNAGSAYSTQSFKCEQCFMGKNRVNSESIKNTYVSIANKN